MILGMKIKKSLSAPPHQSSPSYNHKGLSNNFKQKFNTILDKKESLQINVDLDNLLCEISSTTPTTSSPSCPWVKVVKSHFHRTARRLKKMRNWMREMPMRTSSPRKKRKRHCLIFIRSLLVVTVSIIIISIYFPGQPYRVNNNSSSSELNSKNPIPFLLLDSFANADIFSIVKLRPHKCHYPTLDPYDVNMLKVIQELQDKHKVHNRSCALKTNKAPVSFVADYKYLTQVQPLKLNEDRIGTDLPTCCYIPICRVGDGENRMGDSCTKLTSNITLIDEEFIELHCKMPIFHTNYRDAFAFIPDKPEVESRLAKIPTDPENRLSVIILGMDSVSHMHFIRQMTQSHDYLVKELNAIPMNGYTKVAENTLPNVIPFLTGLTQTQFESCLPSTDLPAEVHLDDCPFIWKEFASRGYRTSYGEDQNNIGIFHMYWPKAFSLQPTDYYLRPFTTHMESVFGHDYCQGTRSSFKVLLDNIFNMAEAMAVGQRLYFQYTWSTRLSHDHIENLHFGDKDLLSTLKKLKGRGFLNRTALILLSDHGSRLNEMRSSSQGAMEDRMPLAYFVLPDWFEGRFPLAMANLRVNSHRLTTPFDIHETLSSFWNLNSLTDGQVLKREKESRENGGKKSMGKYENLFTKISKNRTCFGAGIPLHWCVCNLKEPIDTDSALVREGMTFMLESVNRYVRERSGDCTTLELQSISEALQWKDERYDRDDGNGTSQLVSILQISFVTQPGGGTFEGTVVKSPTLSEGWALTERVIRTNSYGDQSYCVDDFEIKEYCYCHEFEEFF